MATGARTSLYRYDPYGNPTTTPAGTTPQELYTGQWDKKHEPTSNLIEMGARPYSPDLGRFLTTDPIDGGSANQYDYVGQDPVNALDLTGERQAPTGDYSSFSICSPHCNVAPTGGFMGIAVSDALQSWVLKPVSKYGGTCVFAIGTGAIGSASSGPVAWAIAAGNCSIAVTSKVLESKSGKAKDYGTALNVASTFWSLSNAYAKGWKRWYDARYPH